MTCNAIKKCTHRCISGNCRPVTCNAKSCSLSCTGGGCFMVCNGQSCEQSCSRGGCDMQCHGQSCEQSCTNGNCDLQCPLGATKCQQRCIINKNKCKKAVVPVVNVAPTAAVVPPECSRIHNRICFQSCAKGGSTMICNKSPFYDSCDQSCTGE